MHIIKNISIFANCFIFKGFFEDKKMKKQKKKKKLKKKLENPLKSLKKIKQETGNFLANTLLKMNLKKTA